MMTKLIILSLIFFVSSCWGTGLAFPANIWNEAENKASLQRGAALFMNYCAGCHGLKYLRYNKMAQDLGIPTSELLKKNLIFTQAEVYEPIETALSSDDAEQWFGVVPPDLSLIARQRGLPWLHGYLTGFYTDKNRPFGVNNVLAPNVAMPDVLESLRDGHHKYLVSSHNEDLPAEHFQQAVADLLHFLSYAGEPVLVTRQRLGLFVLSFLLLFLLPVYYLKKFYWWRLH